MENEINNINWTIIGGILSFIIPVCLTFFTLWIKNFSSPSEIKKLKGDVDECNKEISGKIDALVNSIQTLSREFDGKLSGLKKSMEDKHFGDHEEIINKINLAKEDLARLTADIMVLQANQMNSEKTLDEIKEDYKNVAKRIESIIDKMIEYMSATD